MSKKVVVAASLILSVIWIATMQCVVGDTIVFTDGSKLENCFIRDEGIRLLVWERLQDVGTSNFRIIPRSALAEIHPNPKIERGDDWDAKPPLPDLSVTFIEMNPKLAGLHGVVQYDVYGRPKIAGAKALADTGDRAYLYPEETVKNLKLKYKPGETITLTAHVKNFGFTDAKPFAYRWLIDGEEMSRGRYPRPIKELDEATFDLKWKWEEGFHYVTFQVEIRQPEIATINNTATDPLWGFAFFYVVNPKRAESWHHFRSAYGTFSWEDFYRWHLDIMNTLFKASVFPSAPEGIKAQVRLDRIIYLDKVNNDTVRKALVAEDGIGYHQGGWIWNDSEEESKTGVFKQTDKVWRNQTEWSLPHELGHQLGIVDYYAVDYAGHEDHTWPDNGENISHFQNHPIAMMHWHGPQPFNEITAMYLNTTIDKPRGHFGDHYFDIPDENFLRIVDVNGRGVPGAKVEIYQRGAKVDPEGKPGKDHGVTYYPVVEDGNFGYPVSKDPVIVGMTDKDGILRLPNRPVKEVRTLNGYHRKPNPFGNINVVGGRCLMLVKVTKNDRPAWFWLEAVDYNLACYTGYRDRYVRVLQTPYGSVDSPKSPLNVKWQYTDNTKKKVRVAWDAPEVRERNYLERAVAYRVYRRCGPMGLNDRPWFPVGTVNEKTREFIVDLDLMMVNDIMWFSRTDRFAVSTVGELGIQSELVQATEVQPETK